VIITVVDGIIVCAIIDSFGVLLFEMFCGRLPFPFVDPTELVHCHIAARPPLPEAVPSSFVQILATLLGMCWSASPLLSVRFGDVDMGLVRIA
jgi:serine/threonine protein kinase